MNVSHSISTRSPSKVLASATTGAAELFSRFGGDVDRIFGQAGIDIDETADPVNELNLEQYCRLFETAASNTDNETIGLEFGRHFQPKQLGALGYAAISSPTLSAAVRNMEAFFPAHQNQTSFTLIQDSGVLWLSYHILDPRIENRRQDAELSLGMFCNIFRSALGEDWSPLEVRFEHDGPAGGGAHSAAFRAPVRFGRRTNAFAFRRRDLDARMPEADPYLFSIIRPFLEQRCQKLEAPEDFATIVRDQIKMNLSSAAPIPQEIAKALGMTDLEFRKELKRHSVHFNDLVKAAREELALHYLSESDMPLTEIALNLGYSELSAFSRAFRNWAGMSPQRYRRLHT
ncbi:MAG: AraC family transcriptional regulator [Roseovarius sp.]|nr:AraC family transcriptional regulator [Roseovarius sp.]